MFLHQLEPSLLLALGLAILSASLGLFTSLAAKSGHERDAANNTKILSSNLHEAFAVQKKHENQNEQASETIASRRSRYSRSLPPGAVASVVLVAKDCMVLSYIPGWDHGEVDNIGMGGL